MRVTFISFLLLSFTNAFSQNSKPLMIGLIDEIYSNELGEKRVVNIYLPEDYNPKDSIRYPVIYLLDGSIEEDFLHVAGLVQFNSFSWINRIPKSILVGIATVDRRRDFTFPSTLPDERQRYPTTGQSTRFISFIEKELQPFIEKKYKANTDRMLIGQSLGGLLATEVLLKKPSLFNRFVIVSPSLWWDNGSLLKFTIERQVTQPTSVYIGVGKEGLTPSTNPRVMEVDANLLVEKLKSTKNKFLNVQFDYLPDEDHATIMHQAVFNAFKLLYPPKEH